MKERKEVSILIGGMYINIYNYLSYPKLLLNIGVKFTQTSQTIDIDRWVASIKFYVANGFI